MKLLRVGAVLALGLALAAPVTALVLDRFWAVTVQPVVPATPEAVALNRSLHEKGQNAAEIYGIPTAKPMRVLFPRKASLLRPPEDPALRLLLVDKQRGDNPLQIKTVWFLAWRLGAGLAGLGLLGLGLGFVLSRRSAARQRSVIG
jgi:hypothetical protein